MIDEKVRALTGKVLAKALAEQYNKIAIFVIKDNLCYTLAFPLYSSLIYDNQKYAEVFSFDNIEINVSKVINENFDCVVVIIGKNAKDEKVKELINELISQLKAENYEGDFFFHLRIPKAINFFEYKEKNFLMERCYTYGFNYNKGTLEIKYIDLENDKMEIVRELPISFEHISLAAESFAKKSFKLD